MPPNDPHTAENVITLLSDARNARTKHRPALPGIAGKDTTQVTDVLRATIAQMTELSRAHPDFAADLGLICELAQAVLQDIGDHQK